MAEQRAGPALSLVSHRKLQPRRHKLCFPSVSSDAGGAYAEPRAGGSGRAGTARGGDAAAGSLATGPLVLGTLAPGLGDGLRAYATVGLAPLLLCRLLLRLPWPVDPLTR